MNNQELEMVKTETSTLVTEAKRLASSIQDHDTYSKAAQFLLNIKSGRKKLQAFFKPSMDAAKTAYDEIAKNYKSLDTPLKESEENVLKPAMSRYLYEEEKRREEAQRKAQEEARRLEEEARLNAAIAAESDGQKEVVNDILNTPQPVAPVIIPQQKVDGISSRETWKCEVINLRTLIEGVMKGVVPLTAIEPNMTVIGQATRTFKGEMAWPGVRVWVEKTIVGKPL